MITAKNYAAQAVKGISYTTDKLIELGKFTHEDRDMIGKFISEVNSSVHFVLPDNAKIFDDEKKGINGTEIRLPFPKITIEYFVDGEGYIEDINGYQTSHAPKRLIHACMYDKKIKTDIKINELESFLDLNEFIIIYAVNEINGMWLPNGIGWAMPVKWDDMSMVNFKLDLDNRKSGVSFSGVPLVFSPSTLREAFDCHGPEVGMKCMLNDISMEVSAVLELCEALSCSNVTTGIHQERSQKNDKRIKANKLPIHETKMLVLNTGPRSSQGNAAQIVGGKASPRQHLRRGHIRRLPTSNVWVSSCVVGDSNTGIIDKQYQVI